jgi:hypothetical protein
MLDAMYEQFLIMADSKKEINDQDIEILVKQITH